eukprot:6209633-Pleurochrysis_carterae.AAC.2
MTLSQPVGSPVYGERAQRKAEQGGSKRRQGRNGRLRCHVSDSEGPRAVAAREPLRPKLQQVRKSSNLGETCHPVPTQRPARYYLFEI